MKSPLSLLRRKSRHCRFETLEDRVYLDGTPIISEFLAINNGQFVDEDGDDSDWIEIHNPTEESVDLTGWFLTDDFDELNKWAFPATTLEAGGYLTVFASDKDRIGAELHTNFKLSSSGEFLALTQPDGTTIASQFTPAFPRQIDNISYGFGEDIRSTTLLSTDANGKLLIPSDDNDFNVPWNGADSAFDDSSWRDVTSGIGFETQTGNSALPVGDFFSGPFGPGGTYNLYQLIETRQNWDVAQQLSSAQEFAGIAGHLVAIGSAEENEFIRSIKGSSTNIWIGLTDAEGFGDAFEAGDTSDLPLPLDGTPPGPNQRGAGFAWTSGDSFTYQNWRDNAPDNGSNQDAVLFVGDGTWTDIRSGLLSASYVIEYPIHSETPLVVASEPSGAFQISEVIGAGVIGSLSAAEAALASGDGKHVEHSSPVINFHDANTNGGSDNFGQDLDFATNTGGDDNDFALRATATVEIPVSGTWTFGVRSDDGFSLALGGATFSSATGGGTSIVGGTLQHPAPRGPRDSLGVIDLEAGAYPLDLLFYERGGGAMVELFAAEGRHTSFNSQFKLVGDVDSGGLGLSRFGHLIETNVEQEMFNVNASALLRFPISIEDPEAIDKLLLRVQYDDGFVTYLNGQEVARRNAPNSLAWNSNALLSRTGQETLESETIDISQWRDALVPGENTLAFHALNSASFDGDFLLIPELEAVTILGEGQRYFATPTPGAPNDSGVFGVVQDVALSQEHGFFEAAFETTITTDSPDAEIRYTTDGSSPTESTGTIYLGSISIDTTTTLRAAAFQPGFRASEIATATYIFLEDVIHQPARPEGLPSIWGGATADYELDPEVVGDPLYSDVIIDGLKSIPTMSIVLDTDDMFGPSGIYSNPSGRGIAWERPTSVELIYPDGSEGFQVNAGIRIQGGASRRDAHIKHSMRLLFKGIYGPTKLNFPLFGEDASDRFDTITLRAGFNNSWVLGGSQSQYTRDQFARDTQLAMGQVASHGTFVHLYINGLYWGLYNPVERPAASFAASYLGGDKEDWDALVTQQVTDGNGAAWNTARNIANTNLAITSNYEQLKQYIDIPNLIDYMITNIYGGNLDWPHNNWYAARLREPGEGFKFFDWDAERTLENVNEDRSDASHDNSPALFYQRARANAEFRMLVADRVHRAFFNGGALTPEQTLARFKARSDEINGAIIGESARWGDVTRGNPYTRDGDWAVERDRIINSYLPQRSQVLLNQFRADGLYPAIAAPAFSQHGGMLDPGFLLSITAAANQDFIDTPLVSAGSDVRVFVPTNGLLGDAWTQSGFNNFAGWISGESGVGYDLNTTYDPFLRTDVQDAMFQKQSSVYIRSEFNYDPGEPIDRLLLRMQYDDGFVAYLNGVEIARDRAPGDLNWNSSSSIGRSDSQAIQFTSFDVSQFKNLLQPGTNVLAIHGLNVGDASSDMLITPELIMQVADPGQESPIWFTTDGSDPRLPGGAINPTAIQYSGPISLDQSTVVKSRTLLFGQWSALNEAPFSVNLENLRVSEIMFHPSDPDSAGPIVDNDLEFIELVNVGADSLDLSGASFARGIDFMFPAGSLLAPNARVVVVSNNTVFESVYTDPSIYVAGEYTGQLNNGGERIQLVGAFGETVFDFHFNDKWHEITDGDGFSLTLHNPGDASLDLNDAANWRPSESSGGSPGSADSGLPTGAILINEILPQGADAAGDKIELFNTTNEPIDIGGWFLSDSSLDPAKYIIAEGTIIAATGYLVFDQQNHFGLSSNPGVAQPFELSDTGGELNLMSADPSGDLGGYRQQVTFSATTVGDSIGRYVNSRGDSSFIPLIGTSFGSVNKGPRVGPIVINELMYHPAGDGDEFLELRNITDRDVLLFDQNSAEATWRFLEGITYTFPTGAIVPADGYALVVRDTPAAFRTKYQIPTSVPIFGPYDGRLSNSGENVALFAPADGFTPEIQSVILVDQIRYNDKSPWPERADGFGASLSRIQSNAFGDDVVNWAAGRVGGTPGRDNLFFDETPPTAPTILSATISGVAEIEIAWTDAVDPESGISLYQVFRDGILVGATTGTLFVDVNVPSSTSYQYEVRAANGEGVFGPKSTALEISVVDFASVTGTGENQVVVKFTERITLESALNIANYTIDKAVVLDATLSFSRRTVTLFTSSIQSGVQYTLTAHSIVGTSGNQLTPGASANFSLGDPGFVVRMVDVDGGTDGQINNTTEAINILDGNYAAGRYNIASDNTIDAPYVNFGGNGNITTPPVLAYPNGSFGSGNDAAREHFAIRAISHVTIPVGTWTVDFGSDDGGRVLIDGISFLAFSKYNANGPMAAGEIRYETSRGHAHTGGTFTVSGSPLVTTIEVVMYEQGGGDSIELSIAEGRKSNFDASFELLQDGIFSWEVKSQPAQSNQPPLVIDVLVSGETWSDSLQNALPLGGYSLVQGSMQSDPVPFTDLDQIKIRFSESTDVRKDDLILSGVALASYPMNVSQFSYDDQLNVATWTLPQPIPADQLRLTLSDRVRDSEGARLDGEWIQNVSTFSGSRNPGGDFVFEFNVLPGDVDRNGNTDIADVRSVMAAQFRPAGDAEFNVLADLDGNGVTNFLDLILARDLRGSILPVAAPAASPPLATQSIVTDSGESLAIRPIVRLHKASVDRALTAITEETTLAAENVLSRLRSVRSARIHRLIFGKDLSEEKTRSI